MADLKVLLTADLNVAQSVADINLAIEKIQQRISKLQLKVDTKALTDAGVLIKGLSANINNANAKMQSATSSIGNKNGKVVRQTKADMKEIENAIRRVNDEIGKSTPKRYSIQKSVDENGKKQIEGATITYTNELGKEVSKKLAWVTTQVGDVTKKTFRQVSENVTNSTTQASKRMESILAKVEKLKYNLKSGNTNIHDDAQVQSLLKAYTTLENKIKSAKANGATLAAETIKNIEKEVEGQKRKTSEILKQQKEAIKLQNLGREHIGNTSSINFGNSTSALNQQLLNSVQHSLSQYSGKEVDKKNMAINSITIDPSTGKAVARLTADLETGKNTFTRYKVVVDQASGSIRVLGETLRSTANRNLSFMEQFKTAMSRIPIWMAGMTVFYQSLRFFSNGVAYVNELNKSLTELSMVFMQGQTEVDQYAKKFHDLGMDMSIATEEIAKGAVEFARQGLKGEEMMQRMQQAIIYAKISNIDFNESAKILTATVNSMGITAERAADVFSYMGDATATGADEIGRAMQRVGGTAGAIGIEFEKVASWIATVSSRTRESAETIGNSIKSIIARVQNMKEKGFDEEDGTKVNQVAQALDVVGIKLIDAQGQFRDFGIVMDELGAKWASLDSRSQAYIATTVAGSFQQSRFMNIMEGYADSVDLYENSLNAAGIAQQKFNLYQEGTEAHLTRLKNAWTGIFQSSFDSTGIRNVIDALTGLAVTINKVVDTFGLFPIAVGLATTALLIFGNSTVKKLYTGMIPGLINAMNKGTMSMKSFAVAAAFSNQQIGAGATAVNAMKIGLTSLASVAVRAGMAIRAAMAAFAPMLIIMGVAYAINAVTSAIQKQKAAAKELRTMNYAKADEYREQKEGLEALRKEYEDISGVEEKTVEQKQRLLDIQYELVDKYGVSATNIDAEGQAYSNSTKAIQERIDALKEQARIELEMNKRKMAIIDKENRASIKAAAAEKERLQAIKDQLLENDKLLQTQKDAGKKKFDINTSFLSSKHLDAEYNEKLSYKGDYDTAKGLLNQQIVEVEKELTKSADKLKTEMASRIDLVKADYLQRLDDAGTEITSAQREFVDTLANIVSQSDLDAPEQVQQLSNYMDSLEKIGIKSTEQFKKLFATYDLTYNAQNVNEMTKMIDQISSETNKGTGSLQKQDVVLAKWGNTSNNVSAFAKALVSSIASGVPIIEETADALGDAAAKTTTFEESYSRLNDLFDESSDIISGLNGVLQDNTDGKEANAEAIMKLVQQDASLASMFTTENGIIKINVDAIKGRVTEIKNSFQAQAEAEKISLINSQTALKSKLEMFGLEVEGLQSVADAKNALNGGYDEQINKAIAAGNYHAISELSKGKVELDAFLTQLDNLDKAADIASAAFDSIGKGKDTGSKASVDQYDDGKDKWENQLNNIDLQITKSEHLQGTLDKLGVAYQKELAHENQLQGTRQKVASAAANAYRDREKAILAELSHMPAWNKMSDTQKKKSNDLKKELDGVRDAIVKMGEAWWDAQGQIESGNWDIAQGRLAKFKDSIEANDVALAQSQARMNAYNKDSQEYRDEVLKLIEVNKLKQASTHAEAEEIRKILKEDDKQKKLTKEQTKELQTQLRDLGIEWWNLQAAINGSTQELVDFNETIANDAVDALKEMYEKQKDAILDSIDAQEDALEKAHQNEMDRIDEKLDADKKVIDSKIKQLEMDKNQEDYDDDLASKNKARQVIQDKINRLSLDNSLEGKAELADLLKQKADMDAEIAKMQKDHTTDVQKQNYEDQKDQLDEEADLKKDQWTQTIEVWDATQQKMVTISGKTYKELKEIIEDYKKKAENYYKDIFDNQTYWDNLKTDVAKGNVDELTGKFGELRKWFDNNLPLIGSNIQKYLLDKIVAVTKSLGEITLTDTDAPTSSGSVPTKPPVGNDGKSSTTGTAPLPTSYYDTKASAAEKKTIEEMKKNNEAWKNAADKKTKDDIYNATQKLGKSISATFSSGTGKWTKGGLDLYHEGGIVGDGGDKLTNIMNNMMNKDADEQVIMALQNELMSPSKNIATKFLPNINKLIASLTPTIKLNTSGGNTYNINIGNVSGDEKGANLVSKTLIKELKKLGGKF